MHSTIYQKERKISYTELQSIPGYMVDHRGEVGGTIELNRLQALIVRLHHSIYSITIWVLRISILWRQKQLKTSLELYIDHWINRLIHGPCFYLISEPVHIVLV